MSDFLARLAERTLGLALPVEPILASRYEPSQDVAVGGVVAPAVPEAPVRAMVEPPGNVEMDQGGPETERHATGSSALASEGTRVQSPEGGPRATTRESSSLGERAAMVFDGEGVAAGGPEGAPYPEPELGEPSTSDALASGRTTGRRPDLTTPMMPRESERDVRGAAPDGSEATGRPRAAGRSLPQAALFAAGPPIPPDAAVADALPVFAATRDLESRPASRDVGPSNRDGRRSPARRARAGDEAERVGSEPGKETDGDEGGELSDGSRPAPATGDTTPDIGRQGRWPRVVPTVAVATGRDAAPDIPARQPAQAFGATGHLASEVDGATDARNAAPDRRAAERADAIPRDLGFSPAWPGESLETAALAERARPVVQVTIGRIEVRAVPPPPAPLPEPAPARPRVGLEDYLRERNGGRR